MKATLTLACLLLTACALTPTQQKWTGIAVSVVATGVLVAHEADRGKPMSPELNRSVNPPSCANGSCR